MESETKTVEATMFGCRFTDAAQAEPPLEKLNRLSEFEQVPPVHPKSQRFYDILSELADLHDRKQRDYGRDNDPFANIMASEKLGIEPFKACLLRMSDKFSRLQTFATKGTLSNEGVIDTLRDMAVYAVISEVLLEDAT